MSPLTHLLVSWVVAAKTTNNPRDCRLATLAGLLPDADGLGLIVDVANELLGHRQTHYYAQFHHYWLHGVFGAALITLTLTLFARDRLRLALVALFLFHLHLLCDFFGSRGGQNSLVMATNASCRGFRTCGVPETWCPVTVR